MTNFTPRGSKRGPLARVLRQLRFSWDDLELAPQLGSQVRVTLLLERKRIISAFPSQWFFTPETAALLLQCENETASLQERVNVAVQISDARSKQSLALNNGDPAPSLMERVDRMMGRLAGRQEWGVRVRLDETKARRRRVEAARRATAGISSGTRFLVLKKEQQQAVREALARGRDDVEEAFESLAGICDDARRRPPDAVEGAARLVLDAAFLLAPSRLARFKKVARATAARLARHGYELTLSGPWPPYNFVAGVR